MRAEVEGVSGSDRAGRERMQICEGVGVARTSRIAMTGVSYQPTTNACCTFLDLVLQRAHVYGSGRPRHINER